MRLRASSSSLPPGTPMHPLKIIHEPEVELEPAADRREDEMDREPGRCLEPPSKGRVVYPHEDEPVPLPQPLRPNRMPGRRRMEMQDTCSFDPRQLPTQSSR